MDEKVEALQAELQHMKEENNTLRLMLEVLSSRYRNRQSHLQDTKKAKQVVGINSNQSGWSVPNCDTNKRLRLEYHTPKKPLQVFVRTHPEDDSLIVKDGYHWRKYGQKVTKDSASPRAYFRCSMAPSCQAKKKVQRCIHDRSILVATYDGEHNHGALNESFTPSSSTPKSSMANNLHLTIKPNDREALSTDHALSTNTKRCENVIQLHDHSSSNNVEEYVSSLIKDPDFTVALAEAVAHTIAGQPKQQGLNLNLGIPEPEE